MIKTQLPDSLKYLTCIILDESKKCKTGLFVRWMGLVRDPIHFKLTSGLYHQHKKFCTQQHPVGISVNSAFFDDFYNGGLWENIFRSMHKWPINKPHKYNTAQLYFTLGRAELHWNFSIILIDAPDIHRYSNRKWVLIMCHAGNL